MSQSKTIAVMLGGPSAEREVSLASGRAVIDALGSLGHNVVPVDPKPGAWSLPAEVDVVFLALHGTYGEDGTLQEELDRLGVPYTGCGAKASALAFDKVLSKKAFVAHRVATPEFAICNRESRGAPEQLGLPAVLKPARQGSSVGVEILRSWDDWNTQIDSVLEFGNEALVEAFIEGREITVAILDGEVLPIVEVRPKDGYYDYHNKYTSGATDYLCPAPFPSEVTERIESLALDAFAAVGGGMYARVDFMVKDDEAFALEVNTLPGMTDTSLFPKAAAARGVGFPELCGMLVDLAAEQHGKNEVTLQ